MNMSDFTSAAITTETTPRPSLAELLAARAVERVQEEERRQAQESADRENARRDALDMAAEWLEAHVSPTLAEALHACADVDRKRIESENYDDHYIAGYVHLEVQDADGEWRQWRITRDWKIPGDWSVWILRGPGGYTVPLPDVYDRAETTDRALLDGIAAYPEWLAHADERRAAAEKAEEQERQRERNREEQEEREERRKRATPRRYASVVGGPSGGVLNRGVRIRVTAIDPTRTDGIMECDATVQDTTDTWLLLNVGDHAQRLIPVAQVIEILPLPDLDADPDADPEAE